ncbi:orotate phosphoribosyltransferase [Candidatus Kaiserbacteria bacterium CG10_big_fil_rev_8_21_14_0_10_59_10]|uniref:Orotate phosphoribosyltransferase n=1 Tax=Candidatus Kaiserbacteria bacterium CG10_big_fil_rev_8_21_14_0_10_59_10 TaxID=1974612 RepID=A0A2H0UA49_9BACT|nr:MAG: orotate phosphoribosyltransferase [Candidatus Kaiserbacteria bacterium CG10_big_fil_rev_8_21_14_0_10_59_10]
MMRMALSEQEVLEMLENAGAFRTGHFVFTSGRHSDTYINKDALYTFTKETSRLCREFAERFKDDGIEAVVGPAIGAALLAQWTAYHLTDMLGKNIPGVYADKDGQGEFILKRGYDRVVSGKRVLVVEDLTTTGGSIKKAIDVARASGADVAGAAVIANRGDVQPAQIGDPPRFESLVAVQLESWAPAECELCKRNIPVNVEVGHGREFLAERGG